jgi:PAS domain S-box-containing protein
VAGPTPSLTATDIAFRLLVENVQDYAIFMLDPHGYIMTWNRGAQRAKGYAPEEIIGKHFSIFYTQPDIDRQHPQYELRVAIAEGRYEEEGWRVRKDGTHFWANVVITAVYDDDGNHIGFGKVTRDLSERRIREQRELDLERQRVAAEASDRAKTTFLTTMSHELRTPLNAIVGYIDLLEAGVHGPLTPPQLDTLQRVRRSSKLLLALINDVLNIARIEAGQVIYRSSIFSINTLLQDLENLMAPQFRNAGIAFTIELPPVADLQADYDKTQQIFLNLLGNSLKFTPRGGSVRVATSLQGEMVRIEVSDTGRGIPKERLSEIFEPFVQVDRAHTPESLQGVGLGLAISRDLARGMKGDIVVKSAEDKGAIFTVTLPKAAADA